MSSAFQNGMTLAYWSKNELSRAPRRFDSDLIKFSGKVWASRMASLRGQDIFPMMSGDVPRHTKEVSSKFFVVAILTLVWHFRDSFIVPPDCSDFENYDVPFPLDTRILNPPAKTFQFFNKIDYPYTNPMEKGNIFPVDIMIYQVNIWIFYLDTPESKISNPVHWVLSKDHFQWNQDRVSKHSISQFHSNYDKQFRRE